MKDLAGKEVLDGDLIYVFYASQSTVSMTLAIVVGRTGSSLRIYRLHRFAVREKEKPERKISSHVLKISHDEAMAYSNNKQADSEAIRSMVLEMVELSKQMLVKE